MKSASEPSMRPAAPSSLSFSYSRIKISSFNDMVLTLVQGSSTGLLMNHNVSHVLRVVTFTFRLKRVSACT